MKKGVNSRAMDSGAFEKGKKLSETKQRSGEQWKILDVNASSNYLQLRRSELFTFSGARYRSIRPST